MTWFINAWNQPGPAWRITVVSSRAKLSTAAFITSGISMRQYPLRLNAGDTVGMDAELNTDEKSAVQQRA